MELAVQKFLRSYSDPEKALASLVEKFDLTLERKGNLCLLNYNMIRSDKSYISNECRALILEFGTWNIVSRSFTRFFNYGEGSAATIDWSTAETTEKLDGTLIIAYHYNGSWRFQTRKRIDAEGPVTDFMTFDETVRQVLPNPEEVFIGNENWCFVFEYVGPYNVIVTRYDKPEVALLAIFDRETGELDSAAVDSWNASVGHFRRPTRYFCGDLESVTALFADLDATAEGFVISDAAHHRIKCKNPTYLLLHHAINGGAAITNDRLIAIALSPDRAEMLSYFPHIKPFVEKIDNFINDFCFRAENAWDEYSNLSLKEFAIAVKGRDYSPYLFWRYRKNRDLSAVDWVAANNDYIVKIYK